MTNQRRIRWKFGILAGLAVVLVTMIPQVSLWIQRGAEGHGAYAIVDPDELGYSSYLNSLIHGRSRRNDPYAGGVTTKNETFYSIQFFPPYALAFVAGLFGLSAPTVFVLLTPLFAFLSSLAVFWLLTEVTGDDKTASIGVLLVLLCGILTSANPFEENAYAVFSFLRRYVPAVPFPLFFVFCVCVWRAFARPGKASLIWTIAAAALLVTLIYSYFYLWTTAGALLFVLTVLRLIFSKNARFRKLWVLAIIGGFAVVALVPYFQLLSRRSQTIDEDHALVLTRVPDLFRFTEILGAVLLAAIAFGVHKQRLKLRDPAVLFAVCCAITPFVVLNQQVITGLSLQPFHYEQFILSYLVLISAVIVDALWWKQLNRRPILCIAFALVIGGSLAAKTTRINAPQNHTAAAAIPLFRALERDVNTNRSLGYVLFDRTLLAAVAPAYTSTLHILWSPYTYTYGSVTQTEDNERLFQYFYFLGVEEKKLEELLNGNLYRAGLFGLHRVNPTLTQKFQPVTHDEIQARIRDYSQYKQQFSPRQAGKWSLSYIVLTAQRNYDLSNLDRWYARDGGQRIGDSVFYRVTRKF
jgi:hypothetical protein